MGVPPLREVRLTGISSLHPKAAVLVLPDTSHLVVKRTEAEAGMESQHLIGILSKKKPLEVFERSCGRVRSSLEGTRRWT